MATLTAAFSEILATDGIWLLFLTVMVAGLVRGFSGFGTAMIYMPVAASVLPPIWALTTMFVFDLFGPLPLLPRALRDGNPKEIGLLALGALMFVPVGIATIAYVSPELFRWGVSALTLLLVGLMLTGWRHHRPLTRPAILGVGAFGGFLAGLCGLAGPPVIMLYMTGQSAVQVIRANILAYLVAAELIGFTTLIVAGLMEFQPAMIGLILLVPYLLAGLIGARLFRPDREKAYRRIAYLLITFSAILALPIFD